MDKGRKMKRVIKEIIDIEHNAKEIIRATHEEIARKKSEATKQLEEVHEQLLEESRKKIEYLWSRDGDIAIDDVGDHYKEQFESMDKKLAKNLDSWSDYLFNLVVGEK